MSGTAPEFLKLINASQFANNMVNIHQEGGTSSVRFDVQGASIATMTGVIPNESEATDSISSNSTVAASYQNDAQQWEFRTIAGGVTSQWLLDTSANVLATGAYEFHEGTVSGATSGYDVCKGNSSTHTLQCSYNNGSFSTVPLIGNVNTWSATQTLNNPPVAAGTLSVAGTGACATITTTAGGSWAGTFKCTGTTGASTITITPGITAPNGFTCSAFDETTRANLAQQTSHNATTCVLTATSVTQNDVFVFSATAF